MAEGSSDATLAGIGIAFLFGVIGVLLFFVSRSQQAEAKPDPEQKKAGAQRRRGALDRMQQRGAAAAAAGQDEEADDDDDGGEEDRGARRNAAKDKKKQEKREQAQAERQARREQQEQAADKVSKYQLKQQEKEAERLKKEEEERKAEEDKKKKEQEEFDKWKEMFAVDAEGDDEGGGRDESAVERFIDYVKVRKVVNLEDLAADFKMRTSAAIDRLKELEKLGRLSGIFDDRGKYVYITTEEMIGVADWLKKKGRINRVDLVAACNRIIRLNPTEEDKALLQKEARSAVDALEETETSDAGNVASAAA